MKIINIGILAHVDAGKTTITENLLFKSGAIRHPGRVDNGDTHTDTMSLEKQRGITIKASTISYNWKGVKVNIIDTPGHFDFVAEVERSLSVLDGAVLVLSAKEGVQSHTKILYEVLKQQKIPFIIFVNKLDRLGVDVKNVLKEIEWDLSDRVICLTQAVNEGSKEVSITNILDQSQIECIDYEKLCDLDDSIIQNYLLEKSISRELFVETLARYTMMGEIHPIYMGVGIFGLEIEELLDGINTFLPVIDYEKECDKEVSGIVYKITRNEEKQKSTYVRLYSGCINVRDNFSIPGRDIADKITKIEKFEHGKLKEAQSITAGDIGVLMGLNYFNIGDYLGALPARSRHIEMAKPTLKKKVLIDAGTDKTKVFSALGYLNEEDPLLDIEIDPHENELYIKIFGEVQMEIISALLLDRYDIQVQFSETITIYKETPIGKGVAHASMGGRNNPYAASVKLEIEPLKNGEGIKYVSQVSQGYLTKSFQNAVEEAVLESCKQGLYGWELTDILITLTDAKFDSVTSTPADFRNLTPMVFMEALANAETKLLEPIYKFELQVPNGVAGKTLNDLQIMRAEIRETKNVGDTLVVKGTIPIDTSKDYSIKLASYTEGKGTFIMQFYKYDDVSGNEIKENAKKFIDPFNKTRYLLQKFNAIKNK